MKLSDYKYFGVMSDINNACFSKLSDIKFYLKSCRFDIFKIDEVVGKVFGFNYYNNDDVIEVVNIRSIDDQVVGEYYYNGLMEKVILFKTASEYYSTMASELLSRLYRFVNECIKIK